jgi:uncharacterized protein YndB with AHSA1/START domain
MDMTTDALGTDDLSNDDLEISMERVLKAPRELVFDAWVEPRHLRRWSAPHGFEIPECGGEARPGGRWFATMRAPEGESLRLEGRYLEVVRPERLVFTHQWVEAGCAPGPETLVSVSFEAVEGGTLMRFRQTGFAAAEYRDGHAEGWSQCFERLAAVLAEVA